MREIKFRVWDKKERKFRLPFEFAIDGDGVLVSFEGDYWRNVTDKDRYEISFYTGLKDKNGREIYEGDIIRFMPLFSVRQEHRLASEFMVSKVYWSGGGFRVEVEKVVTDEIRHTISIELSDCYYREIIGNIYENPELSEIS